MENSEDRALKGKLSANSPHKICVSLDNAISAKGTGQDEERGNFTPSGGVVSMRRRDSVIHKQHVIRDVRQRLFDDRLEEGGREMASWRGERGVEEGGVERRVGWRGGGEGGFGRG